jgi:hypothetical protein
MDAKEDSVAWYLIAGMLVLAGAVMTRCAVTSTMSASPAAMRGLVLAAGSSMIFWGLIVALAGLAMR